MVFRHIKHRFIDIKVAFYDVQKENYEVTGPFTYVKHHFRELVEVAFLNAQDV
jgi:hypothetical protein